MNDSVQCLLSESTVLRLAYSQSALEMIVGPLVMHRRSACSQTQKNRSVSTSECFHTCAQTTFGEKIFDTASFSCLIKRAVFYSPGTLARINVSAKFCQFSTNLWSLPQISRFYLLLKAVPLSRSPGGLNREEGNETWFSLVVLPNEWNGRYLWKDTTVLEFVAAVQLIIKALSHEFSSNTQLRVMTMTTTAAYTFLDFSLNYIILH